MYRLKAKVDRLERQPIFKHFKLTIMETSFEYNMQVKRNAEAMIAAWSCLLTVIGCVAAYGWAYFTF